MSASDPPNTGRGGAAGPPFSPDIQAEARSPIEFPRFNRPTEGGADESDQGTVAAVGPETVVPAPNDDTYRVVYNLTVFNRDGATAFTLNVFKAVAGATPARFQLDSAAVGAPGGYLGNSRGLFPLVLLPRQSLEIELTADPVIAPEWTSHWGNPS